jgi:hypothetical protein
VVSVVMWGQVHAAVCVCNGCVPCLCAFPPLSPLQVAGKGLAIFPVGITEAQAAAGRDKLLARPAKEHPHTPPAPCFNLPPLLVRHDSDGICQRLSPLFAPQVSLAIRLAVGITEAQAAAGTDKLLASWLAQPRNIRSAIAVSGVPDPIGPNALIRWLLAPEIWVAPVSCKGVWGWVLQRGGGGGKAWRAGGR